MIWQIMQMPGWALVENSILAKKFQMEMDRRNKLRSSARGEDALYWSGCVDGAEDVRVAFYDVVEAGKSAGNKDKQKMEEFNDL